MDEFQLDDGMRDAMRGAWHSYLDRVQSFRPLLHGYCLRLTRRLWDAEDLVQEMAGGGGRGVSRLRSYGFCPETLRAIGEALGLPRAHRPVSRAGARRRRRPARARRRGLTAGGAGGLIGGRAIGGFAMAAAALPRFRGRAGGPARALLAACVGLLAPSAPAGAVDGVLEINQACAVNTGCFAGDAAGFPVTVDGASGRSLRLTSDLQVPDANTTAVQVGAPDVSLDLNGFSIRGVTECTSHPLVQTLTCTPSGSGRGVSVDPALSPAPRGLEIRNGSVVGMGGHGVVLGAGGRALDLRVAHNAGTGIEIQEPGATVADCNVGPNGKDGIDVGASAVVTGNAVYKNRDRGIAAGSGSTLQANTSAKNGGNGIEAGDGSVLQGNASERNGLSGIVAGYGAVLKANTAHLNDHKGIFAGAGSRLSGNAAHKNAGTGFVLDATAAYDNNTAVANTANQVQGGANRGGNFCNGPGTVSADCP